MIEILRKLIDLLHVIEQVFCWLVQDRIYLLVGPQPNSSIEPSFYYRAYIHSQFENYRMAHQLKNMVGLPHCTGAPYSKSYTYCIGVLMVLNIQYNEIFCVHLK